MAFSKQYPSTINTNNTKIPAIADFEIENPLKKTIFCNGVEIISSPEFSRKGVVVIEVNNVVLFDSRKTSAFESVGKLPVSLNAELERDMFVRVYAFNQVDTNSISCTINIFLDEVSKTLDSSLEYLSQDVVNSIVSKSEVLFPFQTYPNINSPFVNLINMEGYKKLIVLLSASSIETIEKIQDATIGTFQIGTRGWKGQFLEIVSGNNINTFSFTDNNEAEIWDTKNSNNKKLSISHIPHTTQTFLNVLNRTQSPNSNDCSKNRVEIFGNSTSLWNVDESSTSDFSSDVVNLLSEVTTSALTNLPTTRRYVRFTQKVTVSFSTSTTSVGSDNNCTPNNCTDSNGCLISGGNGMLVVPRAFHPIILTGMFDSLTTNGEAKLSFEILDDASKKWLELIASSEFGTVTEGQEVVSQIGDVNTISVSGYTYALPSTQTNFRGKLTVSGGIETGVTIHKVS